MSLAIAHRGHCRCGSVVVEAHGDPTFAVYCHCDDCRRATGAPVLASVAFNRSDVTWLSASTLKRHGGGTASRLFCSACGSPVAQEHESAADRIFFNTGFMDQPDAYPPAAHTFAGRQVTWLKLHDDLPRYDKTILIVTD